MNPIQSTVSLEEIYSPIEQDIQKIPVAINSILSTNNELAQDVIQYFFSARGKLLRPALVLLSSRLKSKSGTAEDKLLKLAASYEIFHAATLVHDDIIDSAYVRRNLPTVNVKWDAQTAVLVGDFLHDCAIRTIYECGSSKIFSRFLQTAGTVCDGEIHELNEKFNFDLTENEYLEIIRKKTAVLLACCTEAGGLYAGLTEVETQALWDFGIQFGLAFQIVDDCLDFMGNENEFGKTLGADCTAGVLTLPLIRLLSVLDSKKRKTMTDMFTQTGNEKFKNILSAIHEHGTLDYSLQKARQHSENAKKALSKIQEGSLRQSFEKLLDYVLERNR